MASRIKPYQIPWEELGTKDFEQYIKGCYFRVKTKDNPDFSWKLCETTDDLQDNIVDFSFPVTGIYNFKKEVVGFYRTTARQWKRGIFPCLPLSNAGNSKFWLPIGEEFLASPDRKVTSGCLRIFPISEKNLNELFSSKYLAFDEAYEAVTKRDFFARAISRDIFITVGTTQSFPLFWWGHKPLGLINDKREIIPFNKEIGSFIEGFFGLKVNLKKEKEDEFEDADRMDEGP